MRIVIFRVLVDSEVFWGWSHSKSIVRMFLAQRNPVKYHVVRDSENSMQESIQEAFDVDFNRDNMLDYVELPVRRTGETVKFFTTRLELCEAEKRIQRYFRDLASLMQGQNGSVRTVTAFVNLKDSYLEALSIIGFRPPEIEEMYPIAWYREAVDSEDLVEEQIEDAYIDSSGPFEPNGVTGCKLVGRDNLDSISSKIIYSMESFIKVLAEEL